MDFYRSSPPDKVEALKSISLSAQSIKGEVPGGCFSGLPICRRPTGLLPWGVEKGLRRTAKEVDETKARAVNEFCIEDWGI